MNNQNSLIGMWQIANPINYVGLTFACALIIRFILSILQGIDNQSMKAVWYTFRGFPPKNNDALKLCGDRWQAFPLAVLELCTFPIIMKTNDWSFIGA